jgi:hypothetical protein
MSLLKKIREKPEEEKIQLIWTIVIVTFVILIAIWIIVGNAKRSVSGDTSIFKTLFQGAKDVKDNFELPAR